MTVLTVLLLPGIMINSISFATFAETGLKTGGSVTEDPTVKEGAIVPSVISTSPRGVLTF